VDHAPASRRFRPAQPHRRHPAGRQARGAKLDARLRPRAGGPAAGRRDQAGEGRPRSTRWPPGCW
jgi:hypothetical protein